MHRSRLAEAGSNNGLATFGTTNIWFRRIPHAQGLPFYKWWHDVGVIDMAIPSNIHWKHLFNSPLVGVVGGTTARQQRTTDGGVTWTAVTIGTGTTPTYGISGWVLSSLHRKGGNSVS